MPNTNSSVFSVITIILAVLAVYGHSLFNGFLMGWDDGWMIFNDYTKNFSWNGIVAIFTDFYRGQYSPLNQLLYTVIYRIGGGFNPFLFHLYPLLLHIGCALLVWSIIGCFANRRIAWGCAILFAVHPLQVESVAWISASKILLYAFFYLAALRLYIEYVRKNNLWYYLSVLLCSIFSFGGKEQAVTLPVCLVLIDGILNRNFKDEILWREKVPFFLLSFFFAYLSLLSHASNGVGLLAGQTIYPFYQRIVFGAYAYTEYIVKIFLPVNLLYLYPFPMPVGEALPLRFWLYPVGWIMLLVVFYKFWLKKTIFYGMLYYTVLIGMIIQIVPMARQGIVADRYVYLAAPGLFFIIMYYADQCIERAGKWRKWFIGGMLFYFLFLGGYAHCRTYAWESNQTLKGKLQELLKQRQDIHKGEPNDEE